MRPSDLPAPTRPNKARLVIELEYEDYMHGDDPEARKWFFSEILGGDHLWLVDTGDVGDRLGKVRVLSMADTNEG